MRSKLRLILVAMAVFLLGTLLFMAMQSLALGCDNLVLAVPKSDVVGITVERIEEVSESKVVTTYEINQSKMVRSAALHQVQVKYVNYAYPSVMRCPVLAGGFFTKTAQEGKSKTAVINKWAAFEMFGGEGIVGGEISIDNLSYRIVGVIDDGDEESKNIYLPVTLTDRLPDTFMAMMDKQNGIVEEYVVNVYKQVGITEDRYHFISFGKMSSDIQGRSRVGWLAPCCLLTLAVSIRLWRWFINKTKRLNVLSKQYYFKQLLIKRPGLLLSMLSSGGLFAIGVAISLRLAARIFEIGLKWEAFDLFPQVYGSSGFAIKLAYIQKLSMYSYLCLYALAAVLVLLAVLNRIISE